MYRSDLKHTLTMKSRAEEQEKKARDELRATAYKLRMVKDELQITREELKMARSCRFSRLHSKRTKKNCRLLGMSCVSRHDLELGLPRGL